MIEAYQTVLTQHLTQAFWFGLAPLVVISAMVVFPVLFTRNGAMIASAVVFATLGASVGLLMGASREPAVNAIIPGLLTLFSGVVAYVLPGQVSRIVSADIQSSAGFSRLLLSCIGIAICCMAVATVVGANFGASVREASERQAEVDARDRLLFEQIELPIERDQLRQLLSLPPAAGAAAAGQ
jgi:hypothetical protein